ncbi:uncharacterized protein SPPG_00148 [Spizellomyces punctatus DAOM BR117]|uniref:SET domain-containing protein n=1 Tax=Spizellomyces punctatus (strain DAOM BR117) TaxID=645134 RepID=A0A0L0HU66_SPIPD|nr:uncharacterized protein SPPG_00148 [Spizellomyces punctatus DAOM BR117]KND04419.1 hypothetical protein SPPG_00148 [Spizellomyces punctatus DAOM BR117]|eukprot:XP_016612458.1 hypothetical protein SPPG_00148 [Spizellomyces punctatus DAOM BR117]
MNGDSVRYFYPDGSGLVGIWKEGRMDKSWYFKDEDDATCVEAMTDEERVSQGVSGPYRYDPPTHDCISSDPLLPDPYESRAVAVRPSHIVDAGEGLFAKRDLMYGEVAAFYSGLRLTLAEVEARGWDHNANAISMGPDNESDNEQDEMGFEPGEDLEPDQSWGGVIDVPYRYSQTSQYAATLGHKANHSFTQPNCKYEWYIHPRFGNIRCIQTITYVRAGEEILVNYDYNEILENGELQAPEWYKDGLKALKKEETSI